MNVDFFKTLLAKADIPSEYAYITGWIKFLALAISLVLLFLATVVILRFRAAGKHGGGVDAAGAPPKKSGHVPQKLQKVTTGWEGVVKLIDSYNLSDWKLAVIEGDKFVDLALREAGFPGETMGERLMMIKPGQLGNLQFLWDAHKLRNLIVHDLNFKIDQRQAQSAVHVFEQTLRELGRI